MMVKSMLAKAKKQKLNQKKKRNAGKSHSVEPSPSKQKQPAKTHKVLKMKLKVPKPQKQGSDHDLSQHYSKHQAKHKNEEDSSPDYKSLLTAIKNDVVPRIPEDQIASLIPPQSDIATLEQHHRDLNSEIKSHDRKKSSLSQKSP